MAKDRTKLDSIPILSVGRNDISTVLYNKFGMDEDKADKIAQSLTDEQFTDLFGPDMWANEGFMDSFWYMLEYLIEEAGLV